MDQDKRNYKSEVQINQLPKITENFKYFDNKLQMTPKTQNTQNFQNDLETKKTNTYVIKNDVFSSNKLNLNPILEKTKPNNTNSLELTPEILSKKSSPENKSILTNTREPFNLDSKSNITTANISKDNLIKTDSVSKTNFNITEINQKNKEIMSMDQRIKQLPLLNIAQKTQTPTVINNYTTANGGMGGSNRTDPLMGIKNTMRSLPSWRVDMG